MENLKEFPQEGVCWQPTKELRQFLSDKYDQYQSNSTSKGVAWSEKSFWTVEGSSGKPEYNIKQLEPFLERYKKKDIPENLKPLTPEECFENLKPSILPDKWYIMTTNENKSLIKDFLKDKKAEYVGYTNTWEPYVGNCLLYPQHSERCYGTYGPPTEPGYMEITTEQFKKLVISKNTLQEACQMFPEKWCIKCDNGGIITQTVREYNLSIPFGTHTFTFTSHGFPYYHFCDGKFHDHFEKPQEGYTEITFEQFKKHVLTHTDKQIKQENNLNLNQNEKRDIETSNRESIKICRPNLEIRQSGSIRATSFRCTTSKIWIRG